MTHERLQEIITESLRDWFKQEWVRIDTAGNITGPCGTMKKGMKGFKERYGERAKEVMYATATKQAKGE